MSRSDGKSAAKNGTKRGTSMHASSDSQERISQVPHSTTRLPHSANSQPDLKLRSVSSVMAKCRGSPLRPQSVDRSHAFGTA